MLEGTYRRKLKNIVGKYMSLSRQDASDLFEDVYNLTNELKNDIAEAIKDSGQSSGAVDFIDVPQAVTIVAQGGKPTDRERLELARDCMVDGDINSAKKILDSLLNTR